MLYLYETSARLCHKFYLFISIGCGVSDSRKKGDESDFDPTNLTEEEDPSIPEDEDASFASYVGGKGNKRNKSKHLYSTYQRVPSRPYAAAQRNYESEDDNFSALPRQRLSRSCKNPAVRPILDIDIPSSSSPEEFDESIHVMSKAYKLELEAKKAKEIAAKSPGAGNEKIETELVKEEPQENMQMGSPSKKMKEEPAEHDDK